MKSLLFLIKKNRAFTLIEVIVVVSLISILAATVIANMSQSSAVSRDAQRKADLRNVQQALELYRQEHGRYPAGCNGTGWSGQIGTSYACPSGASDYIRGTTDKPFTPKYLSVLPVDPKKGSGDYGYVYRTNTEGTVYKFVARKSIESTTYNSYGHEFQACEVIPDPSGQLRSLVMPISPPDDCSAYFNSSLPKEGNPANRCALGSCNQIRIDSSLYLPATAQNECEYANINNSLAVWGGYADSADIVLPGATEAAEVEYGTEQVICDMPN